MLKSINLPKGVLQTQIVERIQQAQQQHPDMQQRYFEKALAEEKKRAGEMVNDSNKTEQPIISRDDRRKEDGQRSSRESSGEPEQTDGNVPEDEHDESGRTVNVKA